MAGWDNDTDIMNCAVCHLDLQSSNLGRFYKAPCTFPHFPTSCLFTLLSLSLSPSAMQANPFCLAKLPPPYSRLLSLRFPRRECGPLFHNRIDPWASQSTSWWLRVELLHRESIKLGSGKVTVPSNKLCQLPSKPSFPIAKWSESALLFSQFFFASVVDYRALFSLQNLRPNDSPMTTFFETAFFGGLFKCLQICETTLNFGVWCVHGLKRCMSHTETSALTFNRVANY